MQELVYLFFLIFIIGLCLYWEGKTKLKSLWILVFSILLTPFLGWLITSSLSIKQNNKRITWVSILISLILIPAGTLLIYKGITIKNFTYLGKEDNTQNFKILLWGIGFISLGFYMTTLFDKYFLRNKYIKHKNQNNNETSNFSSKN